MSKIYRPTIKYDKVTNLLYRLVSQALYTCLLEYYFNFFLLVEDTPPSAKSDIIKDLDIFLLCHWHSPSAEPGTAEHRKSTLCHKKQKLCPPPLPGSSVHPPASFTPGPPCALSSRSPGAPSESSPAGPPPPPPPCRYPNSVRQS